MDHRPTRVGKLIHEELAKLIEREIETPGALATVTDVLVNKKLEHAKVGVSILPEEAAAETFRLFVSAQGKLQYLLMRKINIKPFPRIEFFLDHGNEYAAKIEKILIKEENKE